MTSFAISHITVWIFCFCVVFVTGIRDGRIRLIGGTTDNQGRVEIYMNEQWGTICSYGWSSIDAQVVCRQLGYTDLANTISHSSGFGPGTGPIHMAYVACTGVESSLIECSYGYSSWCSHTSDAGVTCACSVPECSKPDQACPYGRTEIVSVSHQVCPICRCASCPYQPKCPTNCKSGKTVYYDGETCRRCKCVPYDHPTIIYEPNNIPAGMVIGISAVMLVIPLVLLAVVLVYRQKQKKATVKTKPKDKEMAVGTF